MDRGKWNNNLQLETCYPAQYDAQGVKQLVVSVCQSVCLSCKKNQN